MMIVDFLCMRKKEKNKKDLTEDELGVEILQCCMIILQGHVLSTSDLLLCVS
jgi:hypothetical protein